MSKEIKRELRTFVYKMGVLLLDYLYKKTTDAQEGSMSQGNLALALQGTLLLFLA